MLAGTLAVGSVSVSAFGAEDSGSTVAAAEEFSFDEATEENLAEPSSAETVDEVVTTESSSAEVVDEEGVSESPDATFVDTSEIATEEAAVTSYTITLDAYGGYFVNEFDDVLNETLEKTDVLNKIIPVGGTVPTIPLNDQEGITATFLGWSLERNGEILPQGQEGYAPVEDCVLYAVWKYEDAADTSVAMGEDVPEEVLNNPIETEEPEASTSEGEAAQENDSEDVLIDETAAEETAEEAPASYADNKEIGNSDDDTIIAENTNTDEQIVERKSASISNATRIIDSGVCGDNVTWKYESNETLTIQGAGDIYDYADEFDCPWGGYNYNNVVIDEGITRIGNYAFSVCGFSSIVIPNSVKSIGHDAFQQCRNLTHIEIPYGVQTIEDYTFWNCPMLKEISIPESVKSIGCFALAKCGLEKVEIPQSVIEIDGQAFGECEQLKSVNIPEGITTINAGTFYGCSELETISLPASLTTIEDSAFYNCLYLTNVILPDKVTSIGPYAFAGCQNINVSIPPYVSSIGEYAFWQCYKIEDVDISPFMTNIAEGTFSNCSGLNALTIPSSVTIIENKAFAHCWNLKNITIPSSVVSIGDNAFEFSGAETVKMEEGVKSIGEEAFRYCDNLINLVIPSSVESIALNTFQNSTNIKNIYISDISNWIKSLYTLRRYRVDNSNVNLFLNGEELSTISIPANVDRLTEYSFYNCRTLTSVIIPYSVQRIDHDVFTGCDALSHIYYEGSQEEWKAFNVSLNDSVIVHYDYDQNGTSIKLKDNYESETYLDFIISAEITSKKRIPSLSNTTWSINGLDINKYEWGDIVTVAPQDNFQYIVSRYLKIKEKGTYSVTVSFDNATDSSIINVTPNIDVKFTKFEVGLNRKLRVYWKKVTEDLELSGYEIEYGIDDSSIKYTKAIYGEDSSNIDFDNLETDGNYEFRIRGVKKDKTYTEWCSLTRCPIHTVTLLTSPNTCMDLVLMPIMIDFGQDISILNTGSVRLVSNSNTVVQEINWSNTNVWNEKLINIDGSCMSLILNDKDYTHNSLKKDAQYSIEIDGDAIEYVDEEGEKFAIPVYFSGIKKDEWQVYTSPMLYSRITNPTGLIIPDEYFKDLYAPKNWKIIKNQDDGQKGLCFGLSYAAIAYKEKYSNIQNALNGKSLENCDINDKKLLEYIQKAQIYQYRPECQSTSNENENNFEGLYDDVSCGVDVIIGVTGKEGSHALVPIKIVKEDAAKVEIAVYDCNRFKARNFVEKGYNIAQPTFIQILTLYKNPSGSFTGYHYPSFDDKLFYQPVGVEIDGMSKVSDKEYLISSSKPIEGLKEIASMCGGKGGTGKHLYWNDNDKLSYSGTNKKDPISITVSDGYTSVSYESDTDRSISIDLSSETMISVKETESCNDNDDNYTIEISKANDYENEESISISGKGSELVSTGMCEEGVILENPTSSLVNISYYQNLEKQDSKYVKCESDMTLIQTSDNQIKASTDYDGDGKYEKILKTITNVVKSIEIQDTDIHVSLGEKKKLEVKVFPENADLKKVVYESSDSEVVEISPDGEVNPLSVGIAVITATAADGSGVEATCLVSVQRKSIKDATVTDLTTKTYIGEALTPIPTVTLDSILLIQNTDYTVSYSNNINKGTASITITGIGNYEDEIKKTFIISPASISKTTVTGLAVKTYTGKAITQTPVVKLDSSTLTRNTDYTVSFKNNVKAGTATLTITGKGNYTGTRTATFKINRATIAKAKVTCPASKVWTGWALTPVPTVKLGAKTLKKGTDFSLAFKNNKNVGTATITITGKGNYTGTIKKTFKINPKPTSISKLTGGSNKFTATWKKQASQTSGYQIQYSSRSDFKTQKIVTVSGAGKTSRTLSGLAKKHKYYVRIRTYKTVGKTKYYSTWSAAKTVTTK